MRTALACLLLLSLASGAGAQQGEPIVDVVLEGQIGVDHALLRANLRTRPGLPLDSSLIDEDIRWLHNTYGIVGEASIEPGPVVRFSLKRIRQYDWVEFEGNDRFSDRTLWGVARLREGRGATPDEVLNAQGLVRDHYLEKGHAFAQVEVRPRERDDGTRGVRILVFEGPEVEVTELRIEGLTALDEDDARGLLRSTPGFWSWLVGQDYVRAEVDRDVVILESFVRGEGYLDARVALGGLQWSEDRTEVVVTLLVDEGPRYVVRSVEVEGNTDYTDEELLEGAALDVGDPYRRPDIARVLRGIRDLYGQRGFIDVQVLPEETYDLDEPVIDLVWQVDEGRQKKVRDVIVRGNVGTRDGVVRRYLTIYPGDTVDTRELQYSEGALIALNYFTDLSGLPKVRVSTEPTPDEEYVDVVVDVDDSSTGLFTFILGAGSDSGLFGGVTVDKRNFDIGRAASSWDRFFQEFFGTGTAFHGGGQRLFLEVVPGTETTDLDILFQDPWLDESREDPWGLSVELYNNRRIFSDFTRESQGAAVLFDHRFSRETSFSIGPRIETIDISDVDDVEADFVTGEFGEIRKAEGKASRHVLEGSWRYSDVDSPYEPNDGFITGVRLSSVGGPLGGDIDALRAQWTGEWFVPMGEDDEGRTRVFHPRFAIGAVEPTSGGDSLPFYENFFVGGASGPFAVRGFDFQGVGPHQGLRPNPLGPGQILVDGDGTAIGGRLAAVVSLEAIFPLASQYNPFRDRDETLVKGVLFIDAGNLVPDTTASDLTSDVRLAAGAGVRLRLPALGGITLLLDYASVFADEEGDETRGLSFELSRRF